MQKKIIALAIAGLASTAAFAQSNVTVYGVADVYAANAGSSNGTRATAINSGGLAGSRLGFKGTEDLGGGTKALFTLEYALALDGNTALGNPTAYNGGSTQTRQSFVGLTGAYGTVIAGRLQDLVYSHNAAYNPTFGTAVDTLASVAGAARIGTASRVDNAVAYIAPEFSGLTLGAAYTTNAAASDVAGVTDTTKAYELSAQYKNGPFAAGLVYLNILDAAATGTNSYGVGASYDLGAVKLLGNYAQQQANTAATGTKVTMYNLGAVIPVSAAGAVIASLGNAKDENGAADDLKRKSYAVAYKHGLSKRTALYGGFAQASGATNVSGTFGGVSPVTSGGDGTLNVLFAGVNHSF